MSDTWNKVEKDDDLVYFVGGEEYCDEEGILAVLLKASELFVGMGVDSEGKPCTALFLNCSDTFAWGGADCENFTYEQILPIYKMYVKDNIYGTTKWVCIQRNMKPQKALEDSMRGSGSWDDVLENLPDNAQEAYHREQEFLRNDESGG